MNVAQAIAAAMALGLERLDSQLLMLHALARPAHDRAWLLAHDTDALPPAAQATFDTSMRRRVAGEPLAYVTGHKEFFGLDLQVDARVLVPRPDTETLVEWALSLLPPGEGRGKGMPRVLDLGTGSGAIALAIKRTRLDAQVCAVDASNDALDVARTNAQRLGLEVEFVHGSWFAPVRGQFDLIVSNPPYVAVHDPHLNDLRHEPLQALTSGSDGLDDIRSIVQQAHAYLQPGGWLLLEHGFDQAAQVRALLLGRGFGNVQSRRDLNGIERCSGGNIST